MGPVWEEMIAERLRGCHNAHTNMSHIWHAFLPASKRAFVTKKKKKKILIIKATPADLCAFAAHPDTMDIRGSACHQAQVMQRGREGRGMGFLLFFFPSHPAFFISFSMLSITFLTFSPLLVHHHHPRCREVMNHQTKQEQMSGCVVKSRVLSAGLQPFRVPAAPVLVL